MNVLLLAQVNADPGNHSLHVFWGQMKVSGNNILLCVAPFFTFWAETWHSEELYLRIWL